MLNSVPLLSLVPPLSPWRVTEAGRPQAHLPPSSMGLMAATGVHGLVWTTKATAAAALSPRGCSSLGLCCVLL